MTQLQENLMVKWLDGQLDDLDAKLLIPKFDPENLRYNIDCVNNIIIEQKPISQCWDDFLLKRSGAK